MKRFLELRVPAAKIPSTSPRILAFDTAWGFCHAGVLTVAVAPGEQTASIVAEFDDPDPCPYSVASAGRPLEIQFGLFRRGEATISAVVSRRWEEAHSYATVTSQLRRPATWEPVSFTVVVSESELAWLDLGHTPRSMDDHWAAASFEEKIYYFRSWTAILVFRVGRTRLDAGHFALHGERNRASDASAWATSDRLAAMVSHSVSEFHRIRDL